MIAKPFFDRFKSHDRDKIKNNPPQLEEKLLLKLLSFSLKLENDDNTLLKISRTLSYNLDADTVCISKVSNNQSRLKQVFHREENRQINENWDTAQLNSDLIHSQNTQYYENTKDQFTNDPLIDEFEAKSFLCVPAIDDDGNLTAIINVFHPAPKTYNHCQCEIIKLMTQRAAQYFIHEETSPTERPEQEKTSVQLELNQTIDQLNATNKSLESLSFAVSHELRAPLRSMDNFSKALSEDFADILPDDAVDYVSRIRRACTRMGHMIDDLLLLSKVTRRRLEHQDIDLSKLVDKIAGDLVAAEEKREIEFDIQENIQVIADKGLIKIVIQHLLSNAIKFSQHQKKATIAFFSENQGSQRVFGIRDNGSGFDMDYYDQLFEPFKQLHNSTKFDGTGIGLATVERIIERHHGKIWAESDTDDGATFYFTLPND